MFNLNVKKWENSFKEFCLKADSFMSRITITDLRIYHPHSGVQIRLFTSDNWNSESVKKTGSRQKGKWKQITAVGFSIEFSSHK